MSLTVGSLFSGFGGFDLGAERAGLQVRWQVEISPFARRVLAKHWPQVRRYEDVRDCTGFARKRGGHHPANTGLPAHSLQWVDVVVGGDPCQANSNAGNVWKREHPDLGREFVRVVSELRPRVVVRENPTRTRADALWPWERFRDSLESIGYGVFAFRLRSCCLGAEHRRDRMFVLASLLDADGVRLEGFDWQGFAEEYAGGAVEHRVRQARRNELPAPRICRGVDGVSHRVERLTGLGNAVDPQVAEWIFRRILEAEAMRVSK